MRSPIPLFILALFLGSTQVVYSQTTCADSIPVFIDFESEPWYSDSGVHVLTNCWIAGKAASHADVNWQISAATPSTQTGPPVFFDLSIGWFNFFMFLEASGNPASAYDSASFTSPYIDLINQQNPHLSFDYHMYGAQMGTLQVDVFDGTTWHLNIWSKSGQQHQENDNWTKADIDLSLFKGDSILVQFKGIKNGGVKSDMALDNISIVDELPCKKVVSPTVNYVLSNEARIFWTDTTTPQNYKVYFGPKGFTPDSTSLFVLSTSDSVLLKNLTPGTNYDVYIESICDTTSSSNLAGPVHFTTQCGSFIVPFYTDFENIVTYSFFDYNKMIPPCWTVKNTRPSDPYERAFIYPKQESGYASDMLTLASPNNSNNTDTLIVSTPEIIGLDSLNKQLKFRAFCLAGTGGWISFPYSQAQLIVGSITNPNDVTTFHPLDTLAIPFHYATDFEIDLDSLSLYNGTDKYIGFSLSSHFNFPYQQVMLIEEVEIVDMPPCPKPKNVTVNSVTKHTADISYLAKGDFFRIEYDSIGFALGTGLTDSTSQLQKTLSNLTAGTVYDVYVQNDCSPNDSLSDWVGPVSFRTPCDVDLLPYFQDFTLQSNIYGAGINSINNSTCWTAKSNNSTSNSTWIGGGGLSGSKALSVGGSLTIHDTEMVYTPKLIGLDSGKYQVNFWAKNNTNYNYIDIVIGTSANSNISSFHALDTVSLSKNWQEYTVWIDTQNGYNGTDSIVAFQLVKNLDYQYGYFLDNVTIDVIDSCARSMSAQISGITKTAATLNWKGVGKEYIIEHGISGFTYGTGTKDTTSTTQKQFTGLTPGVTYDVYILNYCSTPDSASPLGPITFTTKCNAQNTTVFENFDSAPVGSTAPHCWSYTTSNNATNYGFVQKVNNGHYASYPNVYHLSPSRTDKIDTIALISPEIVGMQNGNKQIRFFGSSNWSAWPSIVYVATFSDPDDISTMHLIDTVHLVYSGKPIATEFTIYLDSISGFNMTDKYVGIVGIPGAFETVSETVIDDVYIEDIPVCSPPYDFTAIANDSLSVALSWKSSLGKAFTIEYGVQGFIPGNGTLKSIGHSFNDTISGLMPNTSYEFYVQDSCNSSWVGPVSLRTECVGALKGTYTVGGAPGSKNFSTLAQALASLETCGIDSSVVLNLVAGTHSGINILHKVPGSSPTNTITFKGWGNLQSKITDSTSQSAVFTLQDVEHVVLENLAFENTQGPAVYITRVNEVDFNKCSFIAPYNKNAGIWTKPTGRSQNVSIRNSIFDGGLRNMHLQWIDTLRVDSNILKNTTIWGIDIQLSTHIKVSHNRIENRGLNIESTQDIITTHNNIESQSDGLRIHNINVSTYSENIIENNMIQGVATGMILSYVRKTSIVHNSAKSDGSALSVLSEVSDLSFYNNIFYGNQAFTIQNYPNTKMDYNCYYSTSSVLAHVDGEAYYDLASLQLDYPTEHLSSLAGDPIFYSPTDLHVKGALVNDMGDNLNSTPTDIDGEPRPSPYGADVDMGADEFNIVPIDLASVSVLATNAALCEGSPLQIDVRILNNGTDTLNAASFKIDAFGFSQTIQKTFSLPPFTSDTLTLGATFANALPGTHTITIVGTAIGDSIKTNDTARTDFFIQSSHVPLAVADADTLCFGDSTQLYVMTFTTGSFIWVLNNDTIATSTPFHGVWSKPIGATQTYYIYHVPSSTECALRDTVINIYPKPAPTAKFTHSLGAPDSTHLDVVFNAHQSLQTDSVYWDFGDGTFSSNSPITHSYTQNGVYDVILYTFNDCGKDTAHQTVSIAGISIEETLFEKTFSVYPNPNQGHFRIAFSIEGLNRVNLSVFNLNGKLVLNESLGSISGSYVRDVYLQNASKGVYIVRLQSEQKIIYKRIVIQ